MGNKFSTKKSKNKIDFDWNELNINCLDIVDFKWQWENLVIAGGGIKAVAFSGTLHVLEVAGVLCKIKRYCGTSAGAIIATSLALGYSANEITDLLLNTDFDRFKESNIFDSSTGLIQNYGLHTGSFFYEWLGKLISKKTGEVDTTFKQIKKQFNKKLFITGCNVNNGKTVYFSHRTHPTMPLRLAVRISMSIPFMFQPVLYMNEYYVDGGMFDNYPLDCFDHNDPNNRNDIIPKTNSRTLGLRLMADNESADKQMYHSNYKCDSFMNFVSALLTHTFEEVERSHLTESYWARSIQVRTGHVKATEFDLDINTKCDLIRSGCTAATYYLRDWVRSSKTHSRADSIRRDSSSCSSDSYDSTGSVPGVLDISNVDEKKLSSPPKSPKKPTNNPVTKLFRVGQKKLSRNGLEKIHRGHEFYLLASQDTRDSVLLFSRQKEMDSMIEFTLPGHKLRAISIDETIKEEE